MNKPLIPRFSACWTNFFVISRSELTYSWRNCTWPGAALSTISSNEHDANVGIYAGRISVLAFGDEEIMSDHLDDIMFRRGSCEVELAIWVS